MRWTRLALASIFALAAAGVAAEPLYVRNLAPVAGLIGIPVMRTAQVLDRGQWSLQLNNSIANTQSSDVEPGEMLLFDGETVRLAPALRYSFARDWELEVEIPWQRHSGGQLDSLIENWHSLWGLPNGNRDEFPQDQLFFGYSAGDTGFVYADTESGLGDASLALTRRLWQGEGVAVSARGQLKLATGDEDAWLGSGSADYSLGLLGSGSLASESAWYWHGQLGYTRAGKIAQLEDLQKRNLWYAGLGLEWHTWRRVHLKLQLDGHSAPANSGLTQLGDPAVQLSAGVTWLPATNWALDFSISEDLAVETAPDVVFQIGLRYRE